MVPKQALMPQRTPGSYQEKTVPQGIEVYQISCLLFLFCYRGRGAIPHSLLYLCCSHCREAWRQPGLKSSPKGLEGAEMFRKGLSVAWEWSTAWLGWVLEQDPPVTPLPSSS